MSDISFLKGKSWEWCKENFKQLTMEEYEKRGGFKPDDIIFWSRGGGHIFPEEEGELVVLPDRIHLFTNFERSSTVTEPMGWNYTYLVYDIEFIQPGLYDIEFIQSTPVSLKFMNYKQPLENAVGYRFGRHVLAGDIYILEGKNYNNLFINWPNENPLEVKE